VETIVSDQGYGANEYIETQKPLVIVTGPGPGSGNWPRASPSSTRVPEVHPRRVCQVRDLPVWNLPLKSPVNVAYEAATADIKDFNVIDPFHLEAYDRKAINYNRDVEIFPVLERSSKRSRRPVLLQIPTDMGVNLVGNAITDRKAADEAAIQEIIRRYFRYRCEYVMGFTERDTVQRVELFIKDFQAQAGAQACG